jgi:predicted acylesterase/phospholipase RssA
MFSTAAVLLSSTAGAGQHAAPLRPVPALEQVNYCQALYERGEDTKTLRRCFAEATNLFEEGIDVRRSAPQRGAALEQHIEAGVQEIVELVQALPIEHPEQIATALQELQTAISTLRVRLSQKAAEDHVELSLVSRGGASLGNWQAGFLFSVTEWAKNRRGRDTGYGASSPAFSTVTGASAGAVNGFAATIEGCKEQNLSARASLFYQIWVDLGLFGRYGAPGLFPKDERSSSALALFTGEALEATLDKAGKYVEIGDTLPGCSVDFGFVATHIDPKESPVHVRPDGVPILSTKKLKEKFSVRLRFRDPSTSGGHLVHVENIGPDPTRANDQIFYAGIGHSKEVTLEALMTGVRASGAFPGAFPPVSFPYTQFVPGPSNSVVPHERSATFIDGGILDNTPVGLAVALDSWRDKQAGLDLQLEGLQPKQPRTYIFLEPLVRSWRLGGAAGAGPSEGLSDLVQTYLGFTGDLLATTVDAELSDTAERFEFIRRERSDWTQPRLSVPERRMPITGAQLSHFMAFVERDFRIFDFYVGMADAFAYLERESCLSTPQGVACEPNDRLASLDGMLKDENPNYRCIRAFYESEMANGTARISTNELPAECTVLREASCKKAGAHDGPDSVRAFLASGTATEGEAEHGCVGTAIANHNFKALLVAMHNLKLWMQSDHYSEADELDRFFDELSTGKHRDRFIYVDLSLHLDSHEGYLDSDAVKQAFRTLVQESILRIASEQKGLSRYFIQMGARTAADLAYGKYYPKHTFALGIVQAGIEGVYGRRLAARDWRWDSTVRFFKIRQEKYTPDLEPLTNEFNVSTQATWVSTPSKFFDLELGAGWAVSEILAWNDSHPGHVAFRTGPRASVAVVALQRVYLAANVDWYPFKWEEGNYQRTGANVADDWNWNIGVGWRFLY